MLKYTIIFIIGCSLAACTKKDVADNTFTVSMNKTTYKVGDTVVFTFTGNPDFITFYSGEPGYNFISKDSAVLNGQTQLQFTSYKQNGAQLNSLQLLASTDFKAAYNVQGVKAATWTDITNRATLSTGNDNTPSGIVDISDFVQPYQQVFLAFRKMDANSPTLKPNQWTIRSFNVNIKLGNDSLYPVATLANAGWLAVDSMNSSYKWTISSTALVAAGGNINTAANEDWVITKALTPLNITPDAGIPVKWIDSKRTDSYTYIYNTPGTYNIVFVAKNQSIYGQKTIQVRIPITITP